MTKIIERPDEELLIFSLDLGKRRLFDALLIYEDLEEDRYYVPLSDFVDALEFPIAVDDQTGTANGWFLNEDRVFSLNLSSAQAQSGGAEFDLTSEDIERHADGIYVSLEMLEKWFPITLDVDFSDLRLVVKSLEPLPIELRLEREKKRDDISKNKASGRKEYALADIDPPLFTTPIVNVSAQSVYNNADNTKRVAHTGTALVSSVVAGQDFLMSINDSTSNGQGPDIRARLGRRDLNGNLFGIGGTEYALGDIYSNTLPYIASSSSGRGAYFSTFSDNDNGARQSGTTRLRGELLTGYQVDVMRNGQLIDFLEEPDENGEYIFDLDVLPGLNVFELVFYGPQGQKDVKEERVFIPLNSTNKGDFEYRVNVLERNRNLLTNHGGSSNDLDFAKHRITAEAQYGITDLTSLYAGLSDVTIDGERQRYGVLRASRSFGAVRTDATYGHSFKSGHVLGLRLQTVYKGISLQAEHSTYRNNFTSEETESASISGMLEHDTEIRMSGALPFMQGVPLTLNLQRLSNTEGQERYSWNLRATKNIQKIRVSSDFSQVIDDRRDRETDLSFQVSSRIDKLNLRGNANFDIEPDSNLRNLSVLADWQVSPRASLRFGAERSGLGDDVVHDFTLGGSYKFDPAIIGLNANYTDEGDLRAILSTSFSLGYDPVNRSALFSHERMAQTAMITPRVYYDTNNNGTFDADDHWMEGVTFDGSGFDKNIKTNKNGHALLRGIDEYERTTLKINESSLPDPFLRPVQDPKDYILRAGQVVRKTLPVALVGEVDGEVMIAQNGKNKAAQSFIVELINTSDPQKIYTAKTEYDGFIWLQEIPMGTYRASLNQAQLSELGYCNNETQEVTLHNDEPMASMQRFTIWPKTQDGDVEVILGYGSIQSLQQRWDVLKPNLESLFYDLNTYPPAYILTKEEEQGELSLRDVETEAAKEICTRLTEDGISCEILRREGAGCLSSFVSIPQISADRIIEQSMMGDNDDDLDAGG